MLSDEEANRQRMEEPIQMSVAGITLDPSNNMPIVILKDLDNQIAIPIWIGLVEASAIATELEGIQLGRPMTHDLLKSILDSLGGRLDKIVINDLRDNTFFALLSIVFGQDVLEIDSRPSDAIALALRTNAEVYVTKKVIECSQQMDMEALQEVLERNHGSSDKEGESGKTKLNKDRWTEVLEGLQPEDFGKYKM
jgi:bifunctional DNase/RNase